MGCNKENCRSLKKFRSPFFPSIALSLFFFFFLEGIVRDSLAFAKSVWLSKIPRGFFTRFLRDAPSLFSPSLWLHCCRLPLLMLDGNSPSIFNPFVPYHLHIICILATKEQGGWRPTNFPFLNNFFRDAAVLRLFRLLFVQCCHHWKQQREKSSATCLSFVSS